MRSKANAAIQVLNEKKKIPRW